MTETTVAPRLLEEGDPADDTRAFRRTLGQFATGVTVIATNFDGTFVGMAANSFSAVSLDPPLVLWSIRKESKSVPAFVGNGHFAVNVLSEDQMDVSALFGRPSPDQFDRLGWKPGRNGDPLLDGAIAHFDCVTESVVDGGDHHIVVGRVVHYSRYEGAPLLFAQGGYGVSRSHPGLALGEQPSDRDDEQQSEELLFMSLVQATDNHMSSLFQEHRRHIGLTVATSRILNRLVRGACDKDTLERDTFLGDNAVEDALSDLGERGRVTVDGHGLWSLTEDGVHLRAALRQGAEQFTEEQLRGIPAEDVAAAERVLKTLLTRP